jgi:hypothetical protein
MNARSFAPASYLSRHADRCFTGARRPSENFAMTKFAEFSFLRASANKAAVLSDFRTGQ